MGPVCLICGCEIDLELVLSLPDETPLGCPYCDDYAVARPQAEAELHDAPAARLDADSAAA